MDKKTKFKDKTQLKRDKKKAKKHEDGIGNTYLNNELVFEQQILDRLQRICKFMKDFSYDNVIT